MKFIISNYVSHVSWATTTAISMIGYNFALTEIRNDGTQSYGSRMTSWAMRSIAFTHPSGKVQG